MEKLLFLPLIRVFLFIRANFSPLKLEILYYYLYPLIRGNVELLLPILNQLSQTDSQYLGTNGLEPLDGDEDAPYVELKSLIGEDFSLSKENDCCCIL